MDPNFNFQENFQGDFQAGFQGDFQGLEQDIWGGTNASMQPMMPDENINWSQWMDMDAMGMHAGLGVMNDWGAGSLTGKQQQDQHLHATVDFGPCQEDSRSLEATRPYQYFPEFNTDRVSQCPIISVKNQGNGEYSQSGVSDPIPLGELHRSHLEALNYNRMGPVPREGDPHTAGRPSTKKRAKGSVERLRCSHPGCKDTFPRKYELRRHEDGIHNPKVAVYCPVYGCKRVDKPFPRADKFMEHMRKHSNVYQYLCIFENCHVGPRTKEDLLSHLNAQHRYDCCSESEQISLKSFTWRQTPLSNGSLLFESEHNCPLAFLGCEYSEVVRAFGKGGYWETKKERDHMGSHELIDRSKGYEAIQKVRWLSWVYGPATCPICRVQFTASYNDFGHLEQHSKEERLSTATEIAEIFRPCLARKFEWVYCGGERFGAMISAELEEAGVMPKVVE
ncbi:hypothetical protein DL98DRAFT_656855 [Cadophora sp. DSE1049]|nr:hypothetical protein DL98DRAFT_656855 [Cadophora sp. DSE1049]